MRVLAPVVVLSSCVLAVAVAACSTTAKGNGNNGSSSGSSGASSGTSGTSGGGSGGVVGGFGSQSGGGGSGTCDGACEHYLSCKGIDSPQNRSTCNQECENAGLTPDQLANYAATDCRGVSLSKQKPIPSWPIA